MNNGFEALKKWLEDKMDKAITPELSAGGQKRREGHRLEETERRLEAEEVLNLHKLKNCRACKLKSNYPRFTNSCGNSACVSAGFNGSVGPWVDGDRSVWSDFRVWESAPTVAQCASLSDMTV